MNLDRPIFVTGAPRSGKSLVSKILKEAPECLFVSEPLMIWDARLGNRRDDRRTADEATESLRQRIIRDCRRLLENAGKSRYLDDLSYHALRIPFLHAVLPEAKIIHVIRDAEQAIPEMLYGWTFRDSVSGVFQRRRQNLSLRTLPRLAFRFTRNYIQSRWTGRRSTWGPRVPGLVEFLPDHSMAEVAAYQWQKMIEIAQQDLSHLPDDSWMEVRFEQMLADPGTLTRRIAEFCELSDPEALAAVAADFVDPNFVFEKKVYPSDVEWAAIKKQIAPLQRWPR